MIAATRIDWDQWRADYDTMTFAEHQAFNAEVARQHPVQRQWDGDAVRAFLSRRQPQTVVELGGWDGSLAAAMLPDFPAILRWRNLDITPDVPQACISPRYQREVLEGWPWHQTETADALVASHVFEHMRIREIEQLLSAWDVSAVFIDAPIRQVSSHWVGYEGTHILEVGSDELLNRLVDLDYEATVYREGQHLIAELTR